MKFRFVDVDADGKLSRVRIGAIGAMQQEIQVVVDLLAPAERLAPTKASLLILADVLSRIDGNMVARIRCL